MIMIPDTSTILTTDLEVVTMPSKQHQMILQTTRISGMVDRLEAVRQAIYKILNTERYAYIIYSWNYGIELVDLYGKNPVYVCPELERRIKEALLQDDRITSVDSFEFDIGTKSVVSVKFTAHTIFGDLDEEMKVKI